MSKGESVDRCASCNRPLSKDEIKIVKKDQAATESKKLMCVKCYNASKKDKENK